MLPPVSDNCDDCTPDWVKQPPSAFSRLSYIPLILTFLLVAVLVSHHLFPILSGHTTHTPPKDRHDPPSAFALSNRPPSSSHILANLTFSANIALSTVLVELLLFEISNSLNPAVRALALKLTLPSLLFLLIIAAPALEIHSVIVAAGWRFGGPGATNPRVAWLLEGLGISLWLLGFWYLGKGLLGSYLHEESYVRHHSLSEGCLQRIGIIGISLMASLAGFAAVSSLWQTFGVKNRLVRLSSFFLPCFCAIELSR